MELNPNCKACLASRLRCRSHPGGELPRTLVPLLSGPVSGFRLVRHSELKPQGLGCCLDRVSCSKNPKPRRLRRICEVALVNGKRVRLSAAVCRVLLLRAFRGLRPVEALGLGYCRFAASRPQVQLPLSVQLPQSFGQQARTPGCSSHEYL